MLQRGIELPALDVTYFTSLSYYILLLFGLRGIFMLVFRCCHRRIAEPMRPAGTYAMQICDPAHEAGTMCGLGICDQQYDTGCLAPCRDETIDDSQVYKQQMAAMSGGAQMMDVNKAFAGERQALEMVRLPVHTC